MGSCRRGIDQTGEVHSGSGRGQHGWSAWVRGQERTGQTGTERTQGGTEQNAIKSLVRSQELVFGIIIGCGSVEWFIQQPEGQWFHWLLQYICQSVLGQDTEPSIASTTPWMCMWIYLSLFSCFYIFTKQEADLSMRISFTLMCLVAYSTFTPQPCSPLALALQRQERCAVMKCREHLTHEHNIIYKSGKARELEFNQLRVT